MRHGALGLHVAPTFVTAAMVARRPLRRVITASLQIDETVAPSAVLEWLHLHFELPARVALTFDLAWASVKKPDLPALSPLERASVLRLQPDRFFVGADDSLIGVLPAGTAMQISAKLVQQWITALNGWAPVESVEVAPVSYARALARHSPLRVGWLLGRVDRGFWLALVREGDVDTMRKSIGSVTEAAHTIAAGENNDLPVVLTGDAIVWQDELAALLPQNSISAMPEVCATTDVGVAAYGAALSLGVVPGAETLLPASVRAQATRRRRVGLAVALTAFVVAVGLLFSALNNARHRFEQRLDARIAKLQPAANATEQSLTEMRGIVGLMQAIAAADAERTSSVVALSRLAEILPRDVQLSSIRVHPTEWTIEGYTKNAAALIPMLEAAPEFEHVQMRGAVTRIENQGVARERFAISMDWADAH
ncbi:MAG TPA: PilN domain-containing protein [Longimicrobiales bacterium]